MHVNPMQHVSPALRRALLACLLLSQSACLPAIRRSLRTDELLWAHYERAPIKGQTDATVKELVGSLPADSTLGCLSITQPCRGTTQPKTDFCLHWGDDRSCHDTEETAEGLIVRPLKQMPRALEVFQATHRWLYSTLDQDFERAEEEAAAQAEQEIAATEERPVSVHSFWAQLRAVAQLPAFRFGLHAQGGYRRWLSQYLLVSVGAGYERHLVGARGLSVIENALLLTARVELSSYQPEVSQRLGLPAISGYLGLTCLVGLERESFGTRAFVGVSSIVPISFELGIDVSVRGNVALPPNLYLAAGFGI